MAIGLSVGYSNVKTKWGFLTQKVSTNPFYCSFPALAATASGCVKQHFTVALLRLMPFYLPSLYQLKAGKLRYEGFVNTFSEIFKEILRIYSIIPSKTAEIKSVILFLRGYSCNENLKIRGISIVVVRQPSKL